MTLPRLDLLAEPADATAAIVLAHGGRQSSKSVPSDWGHPILRMWPFADVARANAPEALVGLVRYRHRGWNDRAAAKDLWGVLDAVGDDGVPTIALIGHSMGGRAVVAAGDHPLVTGVLALAPWLPSGEPLVDLSGRFIVFAHGDRDRITSARLTAEYVSRARRQGLPVGLFSVAGESHALLRRDGDWNELVRRFVASTLCGEPDPELLGVVSDDPLHGADALPAWTAAGPSAGAVMAVGAARLRLPLGRSIAADR